MVIRLAFFCVFLQNMFGNVSIVENFFIQFHFNFIRMAFSVFTSNVYCLKSVSEMMGRKLKVGRRAVFIGSLVVVQIT